MVEADAAPAATDDLSREPAAGHPADQDEAGGTPASDAAPAAGTAVGEPPAAEGAEGGETPSVLARLRPSYAFLIVVTVVNLVADLWSKHWAKSSFEAAHPAAMRKLVIIEDYLNLIYAKNRGGAWGLLQNEAEALRRPFFLIVSVAAIVFIVSLYRKLAPDQRALKWGLPLVLGGALGNLIDRIRYGFVVDFIDVYTTVGGQAKHWPTFNVADISICIGVGLMAIDMFTPRSKKAKAAEDKAAEPIVTPGDGGPPSAQDDAGTTTPEPPVEEPPPSPEANDERDEIPASTPPVQGT
ncbi:MAG: signal peptidase II [Deltaproteobacteria bacterium]|nr:signal peptidase II [Deltaproteobacteria bacterium]